ncbi:hypothetical protein T05_12665, partial [Trichinella murrelli]
LSNVVHVAQAQFGHFNVDVKEPETTGGGSRSGGQRVHPAVLFQLRQQTARRLVTEQMTDVMARIRSVIFLQVGQWKAEIDRTQIFHRNHVDPVAQLCGRIWVLFPDDLFQFFVFNAGKCRHVCRLQFIQRLFAHYAQRHQISRIMILIKLQQSFAWIIASGQHVVQKCFPRAGSKFVVVVFRIRQMTFQLIVAPTVALQITSHLRIHRIHFTFRSIHREQRFDEKLG